MTERKWICTAPDCDNGGVQTTAGRLRKWCSERCRRRTLYSGVCEDCGTRTYSGTVPPSPTCTACNGARAQEWDEVTVTNAVHYWIECYGKPPSAWDWNPAMRQHLASGRARSARFYSDGCWPNQASVSKACGSFNAALELAGVQTLLFEHPHTPANLARTGS